MSISSNAILDALFVLAPNFYTTDTDTLARYNATIALIRCQVNEQILACCGVMVFAYLLAHYLTLALNPNLGIATDLSEGQLKIGYNVDAGIDFLDLTPYGRAYQDLISRTVVGSTVTNLPVTLGGVIQNNPLGCCNGGGWGWGFGNAGL